ncbi:MAG TPA: GTPase Era [Rhizomicrobium sp.]|jgi:GTP-binding protein Era|nr:GTPase Era [Rhizomicrobium sp.]
MTDNQQTRCGFVAVIGAPNAGKSTLVNTLVGSKVSIVTPKVQTTRMRVRGVAILGEAQIVFVDTPGIFRPRRLLDRAMVRSAWTGAGEADAVLFLVDAPAAARERGPAIVDARSITDDLRRAGRSSVALVLNKTDAIAHERLLPLVTELNDAQVFERVFMISALNGDGLTELKSWCIGHVPPGPWLYPPDQAADIPSRLLAAEITREKLFMRLHDELPYATTVETESWSERKDGSVRIEQTIYVERDSQKGIMLGERGRMIKSIGAAARSELERLFERRVHLFLFVKVRERWTEERERLTAIGLDFSET